MQLPSSFSVRRLSMSQRELLLKHIDGEHVPIVVAEIDQHKTARKLIELGLLVGYPSGFPRPRFTVSTAAGREAIAILLGDYADALVRAGFLEPAPAGESPLQVLTRLKEAARARKAGQRPLSPATPADLASQLVGIAGKLPV